MHCCLVKQKINSFKYKTLKKYFSFFAIALVFTTSINAQAKADLPIGRQLKITTVVETATSSEMGMGDMDMKITSSRNAKVIADKNEKLVLAFTNDKMLGEVTLMGQVQKLNSEEENEGIFKELVNNFKNGKVSYYSINKKDGSSESTDINGKMLPAEEIDKEDPSMALQMGSDGGNLNLFKILTPKIKVGDKFYDTVNMNGMNTVSEYVIQKIDEQSTYLDITSKISGNSTNDIQGQGLTTVSQGTGKGSLIIDKKTGLSKKSVMEVVMNMTMEMGSESMEMKSTTKATTTIE